MNPPDIASPESYTNSLDGQDGVVDFGKSSAVVAPLALFAGCSILFGGLFFVVR